MCGYLKYQHDPNQITDEFLTKKRDSNFAAPHLFAYPAGVYVTRLILDVPPHHSYSLRRFYDVCRRATYGLRQLFYRYKWLVLTVSKRKRAISREKAPFSAKRRIFFSFRQAWPILQAQVLRSLFLAGSGDGIILPHKQGFQDVLEIGSQLVAFPVNLDRFFLNIRRIYI